MGSFQEKTPLNTYSIEIMPEAQRGIEALSIANRRLIVESIDNLTTDPRPDNSKLLRKAENLRRLTVGDYRVIYGKTESISTVTVELVRHRSIVYTLLGALALAVRTKKYSK